MVFSIMIYIFSILPHKCGQKIVKSNFPLELPQRDLAQKLQLAGYDMDRNVITRIETNQRYVTDIELKALAEVLDTTYSYLIDGQ